MLFGLALPAWAGDEVKLEDIKLDTSMAAVERGADTLMNVCHGCHSLKYVRYRDLLTAGIDKKKVDTWRGDQALDTAMTGLLPDDTAMQMYGKIPPDLSLMTKAREGGTNYVYSYLIGYYITAEGAASNHVFPATRMPDMLGISGATDAAQRSEIQHKAQDVVSFLAWASDPHEEERRRLGFYVIAYLFVLTALLYVVKKQIWSRLKK
ncbi:MAG: cytochrome C [Nitrosomonadales bacterium]|nr:cytochrome C [Nitrosomonadales bacterium]